MLPTATAGPQFWLQDPGGSVGQITLNIGSGNVFGEGATAAAGRTMPYMLTGTLEFDRRPGVVDLPPGVQTYLDGGFSYLSFFDPLDDRMADVVRSMDPDVPLLVHSISETIQEGQLENLVARHGQDRIMVLRRDEPFRQLRGRSRGRHEPGRLRGRSGSQRPGGRHQRGRSGQPIRHQRRRGAESG